MSFIRYSCRIPLRLRRRKEPRRFLFMGFFTTPFISHRANPLDTASPTKSVASAKCVCVCVWCVCGVCGVCGVCVCVCVCVFVRTRTISDAWRLPSSQVTNARQCSDSHLSSNSRLETIKFHEKHVACSQLVQFFQHDTGSISTSAIQQLL